jgi:hypothetical protein
MHKSYSYLLYTVQSYVHNVIIVVLGLFERGRNVKGRNGKEFIPDVRSVLVESHLPHQEYLPVVNEAGEGTVH